MATDDSNAALHNLKAELSRARSTADRLKDQLANSERPSRVLAQENTVLRQENEDLKEQLRLTAQQLAEAMAALGRAMEYIQHSVATVEGNELKSDGLSERNEVEVGVIAYDQKSMLGATDALAVLSCILSQEVAQTASSSAGATENVPYTTEPLVSPAPTGGQDKCGSMVTPQHAAPRTGTKPAMSKRRRTQVRAEVSSDKVMTALKSPKTRPARTVAAENPEMGTEKTTKTLVELYDEWARNMFVASPQADVLQQEVWHLYQSTFPTFSPGYPLCAAEELIHHMPAVFPGAKLMVVGTSDKKYVVSGIARK
ncbi:hypothetical protein D9619_003986 [Psilocybe cf. subviscida]|uniref:Uncharacterized protein n=1 Tax=Psilocybe cf. subviscida TaxID=2480587 RepID=A0A8H5BNT0_9AGAR|nr:hypothetical protein D9619_003986 [Psilocybe cf. subviscida]